MGKQSPQKRNTFSVLQKYFDINHHNVYVGYQDPQTAVPNMDETKPTHILQFVVSGHGHYTVGGKTYFLGPGMMFYLPKGVKLNYWPEAADPYEYYYLSLDVLSGDNFFEQIGVTPQSPVLRVREPRVPELMAELYKNFQEQTVSAHFKGLSIIYEVLALLSSESSLGTAPSVGYNENLQSVLTFINNNYSYDITVDQLVRMVNLNRCYFSSIFKKYTGFSPLQYLIEVRIAQACKLLAMDMTVTEVAISVGFNSVTNFGVHFKRRMNMSPLEYKKYIRTVAVPPPIAASLPRAEEEDGQGE